MAYDLFSRKQSNRDWSCGASDLPASAKGYIPESFWGPVEMEAKISEIMSKGRGAFGLGRKPTRDEAVVELMSYMRSHKIGPKDVAGTELGSLLFSKDMSNKIDDLRYDVRNMGDKLGGGTYAVAGAVALLGFAVIYDHAARTQ